jgi:hypothetical protein
VNIFHRLRRGGGVVEVGDKESISKLNFGTLTPSDKVVFYLLLGRKFSTNTHSSSPAEGNPQRNSAKALPCKSLGLVLNLVLDY